MSARSSFLPAASAAAALAMAGVPAFAQNISEVAVTGRAPTSVTISLAGKPAPVVRREVRVASDTVCRNAISNRDLAFYDLQWCQQKTAAKALRRYAAIVSARSQTAALPGAIVLSLR